MSASRSSSSIRTLGDSEGFLEALRASTVRRVLISSSVSRALSRTSVESAEVERVVIGLMATLLTVFPQATAETMRPLHNGQNPVQQARMGGSDKTE